MPTGKKVSPNEINCGMTAQCTVYLLNIFSLHNYDAIWARVKYEYDIKQETIFFHDDTIRRGPLIMPFTPLDFSIDITKYRPLRMWVK